VRVAPRPGLLRGLLLFSVYAPLQVRAQQAVRDQFVAMMLEVCHTLDMQVPTLLLGDFNGSADPPQDFLSESGARRPVCPLLAKLLGPGAPWVDVHRAMLGEVPWTFRNVNSEAKLSASRIDLVLANHTAMALVRGASVLEAVADGGHSPVLVQLQLMGPLVMSWQRPLPQLPEMLRGGSEQLRQSAALARVLEQWELSSLARTALNVDAEHSAASLSTALVAALQHLVVLAGGWGTRPAVRRPAYESPALRTARRVLGDLHALCRLLRSLADAPPACWPRTVEQLLARLAEDNLVFPRLSAASLLVQVEGSVLAQRAVVSRLSNALRKVRHDRWTNSLATLWRDRPGTIFSWLHVAGAPWGSTPILDEAGLQCTTPAEVDAAVRGYWVERVLRQHADVDATASWRTFEDSPFAAHIPVLQWPSPVWTAARVLSVLGRMREGAAPGLLAVPLPVWKLLPPAWHAAVARLLNLVEEEAVWPVEWVQAYVAMIPKASGGSRPRDQRPITVLEVLYRIWSKGIVLAWRSVMQQSYLGQAAMGFRSGTGTLHVVQLLTDLVLLQKQRRSALWLASFDVEKCYDSLPWWAVFGVLRRAGVPERMVRCFESFYSALQGRFRYGQVEGQAWQATNGLAQGCPASPDLLNILLEPFHRWAVAEGHGVEVAAGCRVPSVSFADDVALVAGSKQELETLVDAYHRWCTLLGVRVTKVQAWTNLPGAHHLQAAGVSVATSTTFKMVGIVLGANEQLATRVHLLPRLEKALLTTRRLRMLALPAAVCAQLWETAVLPQAVYGCEVRDVRPSQLAALASAGMAAVGCKSPLYLNCWRAAEVLTGPPLGACAVRDPMLEVRVRQLRWLRLLVNLPSVVGLAHRALAGGGASWREPPGALAAALQAVGWQLQRNAKCLRAQAWPVVDPEACFSGPVTLQPVDSFPPPGAAFTDGSIMAHGGAAVVVPDEEISAAVQLQEPRSSTHCELVALGLALQLEAPTVLTDSLTALHLVAGWGRWPVDRMLRCPDRRELRWLLSLAAGCPAVPVLEKVKAHDTEALRIGHPKAVGNDLADAAARQAASQPETTPFTVDLVPFGDPVDLLDGAGRQVEDVRGALHDWWWARRQLSRSARRPWLDLLYPVGVDLVWEYSSGCFMRPVVSGNRFVHRAAVSVVKWLARARAGCLASRLRIFSHRMGPSPACPCCAAAEEDEEHMVSGCPATGSVDWLAGLQEVWNTAAEDLSLRLHPPAVELLRQHHLALLAALIPAALVDTFPLSLAPAKAAFFRRLHIGLAAQLAEWLRRREALIASAAPSPAAPAAPASQSRACPLPPERQLQPADLRRLEVQRREAPALPAAPAPPPNAVVPASGEARRRWLRSRLERLLLEDTVPCLESQAVPALDLLALFEEVTGESFADTPGTRLASRICGLGRVMSNIVREVEFVPRLRQYSRSSRAFWSRRPRVPRDVQAWKARVQLAEEAAPPAVRLRDQMAASNAELAMWLRNHRYLAATDVDSGESGMALLLLWEVDHGRSFPRQGGDGASAALLGFTKRLKARVQQDAELREWLECREMQKPLAPGLPASHHTRWSVKVLRPPATEAQGWYEEFVRRWNLHLEDVARAAAPQPVVAPDGSSSSSSGGPAAATAAMEANPGLSRRRAPRRPVGAPPATTRPPKRSRTAAPAPLDDPQPAPAAQPDRRRAPSPGVQQPPPPKRRQLADLRGWLRPGLPAGASHASQEEAAAPAGHGRATQGPPT
jgi:hypothetical protein